MKLIIPKNIEQRIHDYTMSVESEIAGMGKVRVEGENTIIVEDVMIVDQTVTGATADLDPQAIARWQSELIRAGGSPAGWKLWWHSHDNMAAFFSQRDTDTMDGQNEGDWMVSLVVNKRRERQARLDLYRPFRIFMDKLDIEITGETAYTVPPEIAAEVAQKVKRAVPVATPMGFKTSPYTKTPASSGVDLHLYCPMYTSGKKECYHPYGTKAKGAIYIDCTTKAFKKMYGKTLAADKRQSTREIEPDYDESVTVSYTASQIHSFIRELERDVVDLENKGMGDTEACKELQLEIADWYYTLADQEPNEGVAESMRAEARLIEDTVHNMGESTIPLIA